MNEAATGTAGPPPPRSGGVAWLVALLLVATVAVAHFLRLSQFGLYEDDYYYVGEPLGWDPGDAASFVADALREWPQGRPIGLAVPRVLAYAAGTSLGLMGVYVLGLSVIAGNALLAFRLARVFMPAAAALAAALAFSLAPADTTRIFPTYALQMHLAQTFALLAGLRLVTGRNLGALPFFSLVLLTYETPSVPLLVVPLLAGPPWTVRWRRWLSAWGGMAAVTLTIAVIRSLLGEPRVVETLEVPLPQLLEKLVASPFIGSFASFRLAATRPFDAVSSLRPGEWLAVLCSLAAISWVFVRSANGSSALPPRAAEPSRPASLGSVGSLRAATWTLFVGLLAWLAGYVLSFTHWPPTAVAGRGTSVHGAAALGVAITSGALVWVLLLAARRRTPRLVLCAAVSIYFALLLGFHLTVQRAFADSWTQQRALWRRIVELCPDLEEGMVIFVDPKGVPHNPMALVSSWADPLVLELIFQFPPDWNSVPRVFALHPDVARSFSEREGTVRWSVPDATWRSHVAVLDRRKVVLLAAHDGQLQRSRGKVRIHSVELLSKRRTRPTIGTFKKGPLFELLLGDERP